MYAQLLTVLTLVGSSLAGEVVERSVPMDMSAISVMETGQSSTQPRVIPLPYFNIAASRVNVINPFALADVDSEVVPVAARKLFNIYGLPKTAIATATALAPGRPPAVSTYSSTIVHNPSRERLYSYNYNYNPLPPPVQTRNVIPFDNPLQTLPAGAVLPYSTEYDAGKTPTVYSQSPITNIIMPCYASELYGATVQCP